MRKILFNTLIVFLFVAFSCETVVDIDVPIEPPSLVVNEFLSSDSASVTIDLSSSDYILSESSIRQVTGASLILKVDGVESGSFTEIAEGIYRNPVRPVAGKKYELTVNGEGFETVAAETTLPGELVPIREVTTNRVLRDGSDYTLIKIAIDDPVDVANFYEVGLYHYEPRYNLTTGEPVEGDSVAYFSYVQIDGTEFEDDATSYGQTVFVNDLFFNGLNYEIELLAYNLFNAGPEVPDEERIQYYVTVRNTSEDYYDYNRTRKLQEFTSGSPFAEPVIVYSNIRNGYGIFAGFSASSEKLDLEE